MLALLATPAVGESAAIQADYRAHVAFLADDLLEGRETSFRGQKLAALYLATQLKLAGVTPFGDAESGDFLQPFELLVMRLREQACRAEVSGYGPKESLEYNRDYGLFPYGDGRFSGTASMVYIGYGLVDHPYTDFEAADVEGKWVVFEDGAPDVAFPEDHPFAGVDERRFSNYYKMTNAVNHGAVGVILLRKDSEDEVRAFQPAPHRMALPGDDSYHRALYPIVTLSPAQRAKFFGPKYQRKIEAAHAAILAEGKPHPVDMKRRKLALDMLVEPERRTTENVVGLIPGVDPKLRDEYVVLSGHYDHLGISDGEIFNGADDNGSGCASLLLLAKHFVAHPGARSMIVVFFTGEEQGLLGSEYFVSQPPVAMKDIVANVNIDMVGRNAPDSIGVIPSVSEGVSTMNQVLDRVHQANARGFTFDKTLDRYHRRSDQLQFSRKDIPTIFFFSDVHEHYHSKLDDWERLDYDKLARFYLLMRDFNQRLLDTPERPVFIPVNAKDETSRENAPGSNE